MTAVNATALALYRAVKAQEEPDGSWPGGDVVDVLTGWFAEHGIDVETDPALYTEAPPALEFDALVLAVIGSRYQWTRLPDAIDMASRVAATLAADAAARIVADGETIDVYRSLGRMRRVVQERGLLDDERAPDLSKPSPWYPNHDPALDALAEQWERDVAPLGLPDLAVTQSGEQQHEEGAAEAYRECARQLREALGVTSS